MFKILAMSMLFSVLLFSCEKIDMEALISELPPQNTSGSNTFGCLVDKMLWIPSIDRSLNQLSDSTALYMDKKSGLIYVEAIKIYRDKDMIITTERISFSVKGITKPGKYSLGGRSYLVGTSRFYFSKPSSSDSPIEELGGGTYYKRGSIFKLSGNPIRLLQTSNENKEETNLNIEIARIDFENFVFSGTFEFSPTAFYTSIAIDKMKITNGRFDLKGSPFPESFFKYDSRKQYNISDNYSKKKCTNDNFQRFT